MSINEAQDEIIEEFEAFDDWLDRYQLLVEYGKELQKNPKVTDVAYQVDLMDSVNRNLTKVNLLLLALAPRRRPSLPVYRKLPQAMSWATRPSLPSSNSYSTSSTMPKCRKPSKLSSKQAAKRTSSCRRLTPQNLSSVKPCRRFVSVALPFRRHRKS